MKLLTVIMVVAAVVIFAGFAFASGPALPPEGTIVSSKIIGNMAEVTVKGVKIDVVEFYGYEGIKIIPVSNNNFKLNLHEGRRFNFKVNGRYVLITPDMLTHLPSFFGPGISADCSNPAGCCFIIK